ncbi:MAG: cupin domain-containing protein [Aeromicrobium erythreum]
MTTIDQGRTTDREQHDLAAGGPALRRLVADPAGFAADVWGRRPLLTRAGDLPSGEELLTEAAVDELVSTRGLRTPFLRVAKDGTTQPDRSFTSGGGVGAGIADQLDDTRLARLFAEGSTLVLQALHRTWPPLVTFTQQLAVDLGHPVQVNAYVTPPQSRGFDDHYDVHDVFVLQVGGTKRWRLHDPVHPAPLRDQPWTDRRDAVGAEAAREPVLEATLEPGDVLYLPRGTLHAATALGDVSTHLTFGVHVWHRQHLAQDLATAAVRRLADDLDVRTSLPLGVDVADPDAIRAHAELVRERLVAAVRDVPVEQLAATLAGRSASTSRAEPVGPLAQLRLGRGLDGSTPLRLRGALAARLDGDRLRTRVGDVDVAQVGPVALARLLDGAVVRADDLGLGPARALVAAGVVVPA